MTTAPPLVAKYGFTSPASVTSAGVTFTATTTAVLGDTLVAVAATTDAVTMNTPSVPSGSGVAWTLRQSQTTASTGSFFIWTSPVTTGFVNQAITTTNVAGSAGDSATFGVLRFNSTAGIVGTSGQSAAGVTTPPSLSAACSADSAVVMVYTDFNSKSVPTYLTNAGTATVVQAVQLSTGTLGVAYHADFGSAGSKNVGTSAPSTSIKVNFGYVELLGNQADPEGMVDAATTTATSTRTAADRGGLTDSVIAGFLRTPTTQPSDAFGMTDSVPIGRGTVATDLGQFTDSVTVTQVMGRTFADSVGVKDGMPAQGSSGGVVPPGGPLVPVLLISALSDYQFQVETTPRVPFGLKQGIAVTSFDPGTPELRHQRVPGGASDVMVFGTDRKTPSPWTFSLVTAPEAGNTATSALSFVDALAQVWDNDIRLTPNGAQALRYGLAGRLRRVYGRPGRWTVMPDYVGQGVVHMVADFQLSESDTFYDDDEQSVTLGLTPAVISGTYFQFPITFPLAMATYPSARAGQMFVSGSQRSWIKVQFQGPVTNPWVQIGTQLVSLLGNVPIGTTMTLSGRPWDSGIVSSTGAYHPEMLDPRFRLSQLRVQPGLYTCQYGGFDNTGGSKCVLSWRNAHRSI